MRYEKSSLAEVVLRGLKPSGKVSERIGAIIDSPSMLVKCPRQVVLNTLTTESDLETESKARGTSLHYALQRAQFLTEMEQSFESINCHIDFMLDVPVEIYTTAYSHEYTPEFYPLKTSQLMVYIYVALQRGFIKEPAGEMLIFHINRKKGERKLESARIHPELNELVKNFENIKYNRQQLKRYLEKGEIPDMNPTQTSDFFECRLCNHYNYCYTEIESNINGGGDVIKL
jgi:hypothetical protein